VALMAVSKLTANVARDCDLSDPVKFTVTSAGTITLPTIVISHHR
jgi:hypothetical protein